MPMHRPWGITILAALFTVVGGFTSVLVSVEIVDSIRFFGYSSIMVSSLYSLAGFILFCGIPVIFYTTGMGLFMSRPWARKIVIFVIPALLFFYFFNISYQAAQSVSDLVSPSLITLLFSQGEIFAGVLLRYLILVFPMIYYFNLPHVVQYFKSSS